MSTVAVETENLGKRYGSFWALQRCSIKVPVGRVSGLVGSNGAGKTTLIRMLAGLSRPSAGWARVDGREPADDLGFLGGIGFLGQEVPLYRRWTAADHLGLGAHLNPTWDETWSRIVWPAWASRWIDGSSTCREGCAPRSRWPSPSESARKVLLLDEPVAALDPLARREFLSTLAGAVADAEVTVLLSSHLLPDLERVCDHLILLADGRPVICADIDDVVASHKQLTATLRDIAPLERDHRIVTCVQTAREVSVVAELNGPVLDPAWRVEDLGLEDIVLAYLGGQAAPHTPLVGLP